MTTRRAFLTGLSALVAAPAVIRTPGLLMPVRRILPVPRHLAIDLASEESMTGIVVYCGQSNVRWMTRAEAFEFFGDPGWSPAQIAAMRSRDAAPLVIRKARA